MTAQRKSTKNPKLTAKEVKLIKALVAGHTLGRAGMAATGSTTLESGAVQANRMLKRVNVQEALAAAFEKHGITMDAAIAPIGKALQATKVVVHGNGDDSFAEEVEDIELQLKGSDRALKLMGIGNQGEGNVTNNFLIIAKGERDEFTA